MEVRKERRGRGRPKRGKRLMRKSEGRERLEEDEENMVLHLYATSRHITHPPFSHLTWLPSTPSPLSFPFSSPPSTPSPPPPPSTPPPSPPLLPPPLPLPTQKQYLILLLLHFVSRMFAPWNKRRKDKYIRAWVSQNFAPVSLPHLDVSVNLISFV